MPSKKQQHRVEEAIGAVDWAALGSLSDDEIARRWQHDADASWPTERELDEFKRANGDASGKPPQAAE